MRDGNYRRDLPHLFPEGAAILLTGNLQGSLSMGFVLATRKTAGLFARIDANMDTAATGPAWLRRTEIAERVCKAIELGAEARLCHYTLHEYVVMPNHVHLLFTPRVEIAQIMKGLKGTTARFANLALGRTGKPFWQAESYDQWCRNPADHEEIRGYILRNPVNAGLASEIGEWPWSRAHRRPPEMRAAASEQRLTV